MSCPITIDSVVATSQGGSNPDSVVVSGTASCKAVNLVVMCGIGSFPFGPVPVSNSGNWSADITTLAVKFACQCGSRYHIEASCADVPGCAPVVWDTDRLECKPSCAVVFRLDADVDGCEASLHAETDPALASGTFTWDFGDSQVHSGSAANVSHSYATPGSYTVVVVYKPSNPSCPSTFAQKVLQANSCDDVTTEIPPPIVEGTGCFFLRAIVVVSAIIASLAALLIPCIPAAASILTWLAVGIGILAFAAGIFWAIFCTRPCGWDYLFGWQFTLGVGLAALAFSTCCPILIPVGLGLIVIALGLLALWKSHCKPSTCQIVTELSIAVTGTIVPLLSWLLAVPAIKACENTLYTAAITTLSAIIGLMVAKCASASSRTSPRARVEGVGSDHRFV